MSSPNPYMTPADIAGYRALVVEAFPDQVEVLRQVTTRDSRNNPVSGETTVETTTGELRGLSSQKPEEKAIADRLGWTAAYLIDLPYGTVATAKDRIRVNGSRTFDIGGIFRDGAWGLSATAVCQERG